MKLLATILMASNYYPDIEILSVSALLGNTREMADSSTITASCPVTVESCKCGTAMLASHA